jgi:signal transduction histidine kinase
MDDQKACSEKIAHHQSEGESKNESASESHSLTVAAISLCAGLSRLIRKVFQPLLNRPAVLMLVSLLMTVVIGYVNYLLGYELSTAIFYLIPISLVSWRLGKEAGFLVGLASAGALFLSDEIARPPFIHPLRPAWKGIEGLGSFLVIAWLVATRKQAEDRQDQLTVRLKESVVIEERNRIAREIHDTLAQGFTGIFLQLEAAQDIISESPGQASVHIERARNLAQSSLNEARRSVWALRPPELDGARLTAAIQCSINRIALDTSTEIEYFVCGTPRPLDPHIEFGLRAFVRKRWPTLLSMPRRAVFAYR